MFKFSSICVWLRWWRRHFFNFWIPRASIYLSLWVGDHITNLKTGLAWKLSLLARYSIISSSIPCKHPEMVNWFFFFRFFFHFFGSSFVTLSSPYLSSCFLIPYLLLLSLVFSASPSSEIFNSLNRGISLWTFKNSFRLLTHPPFPGRNFVQAHILSCREEVGVTAWLAYMPGSPLCVTIWRGLSKKKKIKSWGWSERITRLLCGSKL